jgi:hypothetical protein
MSKVWLYKWEMIIGNINILFNNQKFFIKMEIQKHKKLIMALRLVMLIYMSFKEKI